MYRIVARYTAYWSKGSGEWYSCRKISRYVENEEEKGQEEEEENGRLKESDIAIANESVGETKLIEEIALSTSKFSIVEENEVQWKIESTVTHLHQMFVTKSRVLCTEVSQNFENLHGPIAFKYRVEWKSFGEDGMTLENVEEDCFPLFLTANELISALDAQLPNPFLSGLQRRSRYCSFLWIEILGTVFSFLRV